MAKAKAAGYYFLLDFCGAAEDGLDSAVGPGPAH